ncbi:MAG: hypothetical protein LBE55_05360 [Clostridiales bacterium]|jgi:hypothetical protein|nr:hypothetical protein [Clostridiales bacterium]
MSKKRHKKLIAAMTLIITMFFMTSCEDEMARGIYAGDYPDLYTVAINSMKLKN